MIGLGELKRNIYQNWSLHIQTILVVYDMFSFNITQPDITCKDAEHDEWQCES